MKPISQEQAEQVYGGAMAHTLISRLVVLKLDNVDAEVPPDWPPQPAPRLYPVGLQMLEP